MKSKLIGLAIVFAMVMACTAFGGCASLQTQHQKIAAACEGAASAADSISIGVTAGRVTAAQARQALDVYRLTVPFCQPQPVETLSAVDFATLLSAAGQLAAISEQSK
jgi:outer membrane scaffolding protein for murein synthesis (MipA/OmpV family)